jgi:aromatic ring-opening dioxygenase catalytic subunit (LigB family)
MTNTDETRSRREIVAGLAGAASLAALPACGHEPAAGGAPAGRLASGGPRLPVAFLPHGGGPWPFVDLPLGDPDELAALATYLRGLRDLPRSPVRALLVVSAHWEERVPTLMTAPRPPMLYDYGGFPPEAYRVQWPAPGEPELAARVRELLGAGGFDTATDAQRGFDHGTFVPLKLAYPEADVPTLQLSLKAGLDPAEHLAMGRALAPLRDEGVFIVGSGMTYHNMRGFRDPRQRAVAEEFDAWLRESAILSPGDRAKRLAAWTEAPAARQAHPREEHLLPLHVIAGAAADDPGAVAYDGKVMGMRVSAYHYG